MAGRKLSTKGKKILKEAIKRLRKKKGKKKIPEGHMPKNGNMLA